MYIYIYIYIYIHIYIIYISQRLPSLDFPDDRCHVQNHRRLNRLVPLPVSEFSKVHSTPIPHNEFSRELASENSSCKNPQGLLSPGFSAPVEILKIPL